MKQLLILLSAAFSGTCLATQTVFPLSTEIELGKIQQILNKAPPGIYLTVGGERAFRGAAMFKNITQLLIVDTAPEVIRFNQINSQLLKAPDLETYKNLRWHSDYKSWREIATLSEEDFQWWVEHIRKLQGYSLPEELNRYGHAIENQRFLRIRSKLLELYPTVQDKFNRQESLMFRFIQKEELNPLTEGSDPLSIDDITWWIEQRDLPNSCVHQLLEHPEQAVDFGQILDYRSGNYLFDPDLYQNLHHLAMSNQIHVLKLNLSEPKDRAQLQAKMNSISVPLAVFDSDNLFAYYYLGEKDFRILLNELIPLGKPNSILIVMNNYTFVACGQFQFYVGFTFENIQQWPKGVFLDRFVDNLPQALVPLIDGRLYQGNDKLPLYLTPGPLR